MATSATAQDNTTEDDIVVAVLDSGIDTEHVEFTSCSQHPLTGWKDFVDGNEDPVDPVGHGTAVSSVAVGATLGESACTNLVVGRVCDSGGCPTSAIGDGILWAIEQGADVINLSLGTTVPAPRLLFNLDAELMQAREAGALPVVAAGNGVQNFGLVPYPSYLGQPSGSEYAFVVGASDENGNAAIGMNTDPEVIQAGVDVRVADAGTEDGYTSLSGTSFSAPNVAGIAAAVQKAWLGTHGETLSADDLENYLKWTAEDGGGTTPVQEGWGFVDIFEALEQVPDGMPEEPECEPSGQLQEINRCSNLVHDEVANSVRDQW